MFCRCGFHLSGWCDDDVASRTDADVRKYALVCVAVAALVEKQEIRTTRDRSVLSAWDILPTCVIASNLAQISAPRQAWRDAENSLQGVKEEDMEAP